MKHQRGTETVEFALVAMLFFVVIFGIFEVGRAFFTWNTLNEVSRRGARVAAVTSMEPGDVLNVKRSAIFAGGSDDVSSILPGLTTANIAVTYLKKDGTSTIEPTDVRYVEVSVVDYEHLFLVPAFVTTLAAPSFSTIIPRESLGGT